MTTTNPQGINYVIVVMLENRSYDNMLGSLYNPANAAPYQYQPLGQSNLDGLGFDNINPDPGGGTPLLAKVASNVNVDGTIYPPTTEPVYDPGEAFGDMAQQITGSTSIPASNPYDPSFTPLYNPQSAGLMQGFTLNYADESYNHLPFDEQQVPGSYVPNIMTYMTPAQVPVTSFLAANYGVCDQWFASAPAQTYVNRAFALTAAPGMGTNSHNGSGTASWVNDWLYIHVPFVSDPELQTVPSILSQLGADTWKVYFHDFSIAIQTVGDVATAAGSKSNSNVSLFDNSDYASGTVPKQLQTVPTTFVDDLNADPPTLPMFSFIEPRYFLGYAETNYPPNSNHPGSMSYPPGIIGSAGPPRDVMSGELFLMQLYNALQGSSIWNETLLIITYDEHGGTYDHVPPPFATPPGSSVPAAHDAHDPVANGFGYNVFGGRVPAIIVSPLIAQGSTVRDAGGAPFDHTSIIRTTWELAGLAQDSSLTDRDAAAPSLTPFLSTNGVVNSTGAFTGLLLTAPSFLVVAGPGFTQMVVACDGGPNAPSLPTTASYADWLTVDTVSSTFANALTLSVTVNANAPSSSGTYTTSIEITSNNGANNANVAVTLIVF